MFRLNTTVPSDWYHNNQPLAVYDAPLATNPGHEFAKLVNLANSSTVNDPFNRKDDASGTDTTPDEPSNAAARSASPVNAPATPNVYPPERLRAPMMSLRRSPSGAAALLVSVPRPTAVRIDLYDLQGRRVRNLADRVMQRGATVIAWDGRDAAGARAECGVYFARMITPRGVHVARLLILP